MPGLNAKAADPPRAFLNVPYDNAFVDLYLAYIAGIASFGLVPTATLEVPGGLRRLDRIQRLVRDCQYSFHDLSRVEVDPKRPATPRFNMPFELGLAVMWADIRPGNHTWFLFESKAHRLEKSLSDIKGSDIYSHGGKPANLFRELCNALVQVRRQPTVQEIDIVYRHLKKHLPDIMKRAGAKTEGQHKNTLFQTVGRGTIWANISRDRRSSRAVQVGAQRMSVYLAGAPPGLLRGRVFRSCLSAGNQGFFGRIFSRTPGGSR